MHQTFEKLFFIFHLYLHSPPPCSIPLQGHPLSLTDGIWFHGIVKHPSVGSSCWVSDLIHLHIYFCRVGVGIVALMSSAHRQREQCILDTWPSCSEKSWRPFFFVWCCSSSFLQECPACMEGNISVPKMSLLWVLKSNTRDILTPNGCLSSEPDGSGVLRSFLWA